MVQKVIIKGIARNALRLGFVNIYLAERLAMVTLLNHRRVVIADDQPVEMR